MMEEEKKALHTEPEQEQPSAEAVQPAAVEKNAGAQDQPEPAVAGQQPEEAAEKDSRPEKEQEEAPSDATPRKGEIPAEEPEAPAAEVAPESVPALSDQEKPTEDQKEAASETTAAPEEPAPAPEPAAGAEPAPSDAEKAHEEKSSADEEKVPAVQELEKPAEPAASPKRRLPMWARVLLGVLCVVVVFAGLAVAYVNGKLDLIRYNDGTVDSVGSIDAGEDQDLDSSGLEHNTGEMVMPEGSPFQDEDVLNVLLISTDERTEAVNDADAFTHLNELDGTDDTTEFSEDARADSLILASLNIEKDTIKLVSIERATGVPILLDGYEGQYDWITHTFRYGGARLTMDTVSECLNLDVDRYVRFNFNSFVQIVDAVGGVDIELTETEAAALNWEIPSNSMLIIGKVHAGLNHLDGYTALQYARLRAIDNDWHRIVRQRTVIQAVLDQIQHASVTELDDLLNTVLPLVQTNFTKSEIAALLVQLPGFLGVQTEQMSLPVEGTYGVRTGMDDRTMYDPDWQLNSDILQDFLYEDKTADEAIAAHVVDESATEETAEEEPTRELTPMESYLTENSSPVDLETGINGEDFGNGNYRVFLAGAPQGTNAYWQMKQALLQYLHESQGVNVLLEDCGPAAALSYQQYIETGTGCTFSSQEEADFWSWLYTYNDSQLDSGKFTVVGLGNDNDADLVLTGLSTLLDTELTGEELSGATARHLLINMRQGNAVRTNSSYRLLYQLQRLAQGSETDQNDLQLLFGENTDRALSILDSVLSGSGQETSLADNFTSAWQQYSDQNFFGMFAPEDVLLIPADLDGDGQMPETTLAMSINTGSPPAAGKVCAILGACLDVDGEGTQPQGIDAGTLYNTLADADALLAQLEPETTETPEASPQPTDAGEAAEEPADDGECYFLALDGQDSPYDEENGILTGDAAQPAAEYFQKILLVPSASGTTPVGSDGQSTDTANR